MTDERMVRLRFMVKKLMIELDNDRIDNSWESDFISGMDRLIKQNMLISAKQEAVIEKLFERY